MTQISKDDIDSIASIFIGDKGNYYPRISGPVIVDDFNSLFDFQDMYGQGFPTRYVFVSDHIGQLFNAGRADEFFTKVLARQYLHKRFAGLTVNEVMTHREDIIQAWNDILEWYGLHLVIQGDQVLLRKMKEERDNEELINTFPTNRTI